MINIVSTNLIGSLAKQGLSNALKGKATQEEKAKLLDTVKQHLTTFVDDISKRCALVQNDTPPYTGDLKLNVFTLDNNNYFYAIIINFPGVLPDKTSKYLVNLLEVDCKKRWGQRLHYCNATFDIIDTNESSLYIRIFIKRRFVL